MKKSGQACCKECVPRERYEVVLGHLLDAMQEAGVEDVKALIATVRQSVLAVDAKYVMRDLGCTRSQAYKHLAEACKRSMRERDGFALRCSVKEWNAYVKAERGRTIELTEVAPVDQATRQSRATAVARAARSVLL